MLDLATKNSFKDRFKIIRSLEKQQLVSDSEETRADIKDAGNNALFEYFGNTYFVKNLKIYEETSPDFKKRKDRSIHKLGCLCLETGKTAGFDWELKDNLQVFMALRRFSMEHLKDEEEKPVDEKGLLQIIKDKGTIIINDKKFCYDESLSAVYFQGKIAKKIHLYNFRTEDRTRSLIIENHIKSEKSKYLIYSSNPVPPDNIKILRVGEA